MSKIATRSFKSGLAQSSAAVIDKYVMIPVLACAYAEIIQPLLMYATTAPITDIPAAQRFQAITTHERNAAFRRQTSISSKKTRSPALLKRDGN